MRRRPWPSSPARLPPGRRNLSRTLGIPLKTTKSLTQEEIERRKANDRAYDAALHKIPDKKSAVDPWGNIRPAAPVAAKHKPENKAN